MGVLDFKHQPKHLARIRRILSRRGLVPDLTEEWEIHGPHVGMNYQVYVGYAHPKDENQLCQAHGCSLPWKKCKKHVNFQCVVIYPWATYRIEEPNDWGEALPENRIPVE
mgnify:CR=1 FL=1